MRKIVTIFIALFIFWFVLSWIFCQNKLDTDGLLEFGYPLIVYSDFNGKGIRKELNLGIHSFNLIVTIISILFLSLIPLIFKDAISLIYSINYKRNKD